MPMPYIHFQGHCAEALTFYADIFGATESFVQKQAFVTGMIDHLERSGIVRSGMSGEQVDAGRQIAGDLRLRRERAGKLRRRQG